jgi:Fe2+ or Zn2+ uptake regulation protein
MSTPEDKLVATLRKHSFSLTLPRRTVFEALQGSQPLTMKQLVDTCQGTIDRASIYRTIRLFEHLGIVQRLRLGWKYKLELSDDFHQHHHHFSCTVCGNTFALPEDEALEARLRLLASQYEFEMLDHQLEISGRCSQCHSIMR